MLRGYARMRAEAGNINVVGEQEAPLQVMHASGGRRSFGQSIPKGGFCRNNSAGTSKCAARVSLRKPASTTLNRPGF